MLSALKLGENSDGVIVRLHNAGDEPVNAAIALSQSHGAVGRVDLNEENAAPLDAGRFALQPNEISTLRFSPS